LQGFAPAAVALRHETAVDPRLLYQQFAFLHARLMSAQGQRDLALVVNRPHTSWRDEDELQLAGRPIRGGSRNIRALSAPGPRLKLGPNSRLPSVPSA